MRLPPPIPPALQQPQGAGLWRAVIITRNTLPFLIALVVLLYEEWVIPLGGAPFARIAHLAFYGLLGPLVTFFVIQWIAEGIKGREQASQELRALYAELRASHQRMSALQRLMRELADSQAENDLETLLEAAVSGARQVTGAASASATLRGEGFGGALHSSAGAGGKYVVRRALQSEGGEIGELTLLFDAPPSSDTRELLADICVEIGNAIRSSQRRTRDLLTLFEVDQTIRAERNMRRLLSRVTETIASRVQAQARAAFLTGQDGALRLEYAYPERSAPTLPDFVRRVAESGQPLQANPTEAQQLFEGCRSALGLPMRDEDGLVGVLVLGGNEDLIHERMPLLALLASQATLAVRNARAYLYSEELAISEERSRIAREIHDGVAQSLAFCALQLDIVVRQIPKDPARAAAGVSEASALLREQIREVRRSIFALRPINLEKYGLLETLRMYVQDFGEQNKLRSALTISGEVNLSPSDEAILFRILQESLNNVAKHAAASQVSVTLSGDSAWVELCVQDDGRGFDLQRVSGRVSSAGGLGLSQMRERLESRGGQYRVLSSPGRGTRVEARLPQAG